MDMPSNYTLIKLSDTDLTVLDPKQDIRGRKVVDSRGHEIGDIDDLLIDDTEHKVRFLRVAGGGFLGIGGQKFLIPVDAIGGIDEDVVHIDRTREHIVGAPRYDPDLADQKYTEQLYGYYGYVPFWGAGYMYPSYPFYF